MLLSAGPKAAENEPLVFGARMGIKKVLANYQFLEAAKDHHLQHPLGGHMVHESPKHPDPANVEGYIEKTKRKGKWNTSTFMIWSWKEESIVKHLQQREMST